MEAWRSVPWTPSLQRWSTSICPVLYSHEYGTGSELLNVELDEFGNAVYTGDDPVALAQPDPDIGVIDLPGGGELTFERVGPLTLDQNGGHGMIRIRLPAGLGYTTKPQTKLLDYTLPFLFPVAGLGKIRYVRYDELKQLEEADDLVG